MKKSRWNAYVEIALVTLIVLAANLVAYRYFFRLDFTRSQMFTISNSTKKILGKLKDKLYIKFYVSENLPPRVRPIKRDVEDLLREYENYGHGKVVFSILVPEKDEDIESDARRAGIQKVQLNVIGKDRQEVQAVYMGIALYYKNKSDSIPVVMGITNLEYDLTSKILKLIKDKKDKIVFLDKSPKLPPNLSPAMREQLLAKMPPSHSINRDMRVMKKILEDIYDVEELRIDKDHPVPEDAKLLVLVGVEKLTDDEKYMIDQYLMRGGKLVILMNGMRFNRMMMGEKININYLDLLEKYGIKLNQNLVFDMYNYPAVIPSGNMRYLAPFPLWIKVGPTQLGDIPEFLKDIVPLGVPFASSIELEKDKQPEVKYRVVFTSSGKSWTESDTVFFDPAKFQPPSEDKFKKVDLAVIAEGNFSSAYTSETIPKDFDKDNFKSKSLSGGAILLISSPNFILDHTARMFSNNIPFFASLVDYLANSKELVGIRAKKEDYVYINPEITDSEKAFIKWFGILFMPILVVIYGIIRMMVRNRKEGGKNE